MTQSPSISIPSTRLPSSSSFISARLTFLTGFLFSFVLLTVTVLQFPASSATMILRVFASTGVTFRCMAYSVNPTKWMTIQHRKWMVITPSVIWTHVSYPLHGHQSWPRSTSLCPGGLSGYPLSSVSATFKTWNRGLFRLNITYYIKVQNRLKTSSFDMNSLYISNRYTNIHISNVNLL